MSTYGFFCPLRRWHDKCFQCSVCKSAVGTKPFIIPNDKDVYCVGCFEDKFATKCTKCKKVRKQTQQIKNCTIKGCD